MVVAAWRMVVEGAVTGIVEDALQNFDEKHLLRDALDPERKAAINLRISLVVLVGDREVTSATSITGMSLYS